MKLWIDDLRPAPDGWLWVKSSAAAIQVLEERLDEITDISFDHDLGGDDTSRPVALWLAEREAFPERVYIHSANIVGRDWLFSLITRYGPRPVILNYRER